MRTMLLTLVVALVLAAPALAGNDIEARINFAIANPEEGLTDSLAQIPTDEALGAIRWLRERCQRPVPAVCPRPVGTGPVVSDPARNPVVGVQSELAQCAITERDVLVAVLLEKVMLLTHPDLAPEERETLAKSVDLAKRRHFIMSLPIE